MSAHDYRGRDWTFFNGLAATFAPEGLGAGWLGTYGKGATIDPTPKPGGDRSNPTLYARWAFRYDGPTQASLDRDGFVCRWGYLSLTARIEVNADLGFVEGPAGLWKLWCDHCARYNAGGDRAVDGVAIFTESTPEDNPREGGFLVSTLPLHFGLTN